MGFTVAQPIMGNGEGAESTRQYPPTHRGRCGCTVLIRKEHLDVHSLLGREGASAFPPGGGLQNGVSCGAMGMV